MLKSKQKMMKLKMADGHRGAIRMNDFKKILVLENEVEARLMDVLLNERGIPHIIKSYHDSAYDGLFQLHRGWGHIAAPASCEEEIRALYDELPDERILTDEQDESPGQDQAEERD